MTGILGIDAAWTASNPSGVALIQQAQGQWRCRCVAPSYEAYAGLAKQEYPPKGLPAARLLLDASRAMLEGSQVAVVAVDMPLSRLPIVARRKADNDVSRTFGRNGCGTHSPTAARPGAISALLRDGFAEAGYELATAPPMPERALIEVYPHTALLRLLRVEKRVAYKIGKVHSKGYKSAWPGLTAPHRKKRVVENLHAIVAALNEEITGIPDFLCSLHATMPLRELKAAEDMIDALICGWVGVRMLEGRAIAYGDHDAAIWVPD